VKGDATFDGQMLHHRSPRTGLNGIAFAVSFTHIEDFEVRCVKPVLQEPASHVTMTTPQPARTPQVDPLAEKVLRKLAEHPESSGVVLGGYFALRRYVDYRETHDIYAWWLERASPATERAIRCAIEAVANEEGLQVGERRFGETLSLDLCAGDRKRLSFQIAVRTITLEAPEPSAWPPILIETLADTVGSKMNALVDRGAPRDFTDIHRLVQGGVVGAESCWAWWNRKNPGRTMEEGMQKIQLHLAALELRRPLDSISIPVDRESAATLRGWFRGVFLHR